MPLCGFNQKMLDGLTDFNKGLLEQLQSDEQTKEIQTIINTLKL
jgi:hypothetical protein